MPDYHVKVLLQARVPAATRAWARQEATRRGLAFGDYVEAAIAADRHCMADGLPDDIRELLTELAQGLYAIDGEIPSLRAAELLEKYT